MSSHRFALQPVAPVVSPIPTRDRGTYCFPSPDPRLPGYQRVEVWAADGRLLALSDVHPDTITPRTDAILLEWLNAHDPVRPWSGPRRFMPTPTLLFPSLGSSI